MSLDIFGSVLLFKGDDFTTIYSKTTNQLILKGLISDCIISSDIYILTDRGNDLVENKLLISK